eukprot:CAMPEP_0197905306 /NCGR_PEP_ID=MMETSP1439-20131203/60043_1 /TAXON_ID=66791 /ORGANISM="Gonyaulax spinifera, Strain CCMP409" /LENGTH=354 /DNA_ID=CAMNT_0043526577 /DNA_START=54 /DNA_END=1118 /DNA_ORIENTATION=-
MVPLPASSAKASLALAALAVQGPFASAGSVRGAAGWAGSGLCGIATNMLDYNNRGMTTFCDAGLDFWWNWAHAPRNIYSANCSWQTFVPMIWGYAPDNARIAQSGAARLMGYNEPDLYAPPVVPGGDYLASGTFPDTFHCGSPRLAVNWQELVMSFKRTNPDGIVVSPAMADPEGPASAGSFAGCNESPQTRENHMAWCAGWLKCFKESVIKLRCGETNCWDVIDVLQFHAYVYTAEDLIAKVRLWETNWAAELKGESGMKRKSLWLTEFARAGTTNSSDPDGLGRDFIERSVRYLKSSPYVSGWSWFSQDTTTFASFTIGNRQPASAFWASDLIDGQGSLTVLGKKYVSACRA